MDDYYKRFVQNTYAKNAGDLRSKGFYYVQHYHRLEQTNPGLKIRSLIVGENQNQETAENNKFIEEASILYPMKEYLAGRDDTC